jgi:hypothetical protein
MSKETILNLLSLVQAVCAAGVVACLIWLTPVSAGDKRPVEYRITLYDGGQSICSWVAADVSGNASTGLRFWTDKGTVHIGGTFIIEEVPARTETR